MACKKKVTAEDLRNLKVGEGIVGPPGTFEIIEEKPKRKTKKKARIGMFEV